MKYLNIGLACGMSFVLLHGYYKHYQNLKHQETRLDGLIQKTTNLQERLNRLPLH